MYTDAKNCQILVALLKAHGIKRVIACPGTTNIDLVSSVMDDPFFEVFSCVDERHAGYVAVGMAETSHEPVVISCTAATASRNFIPGLTEAYYRKLPVLAITSNREFVQIGNGYDSVLDRTRIQKDIARISVRCPVVKDEETRRYCEVEVNKAILALKQNGGGPANIELEMKFPLSFKAIELPKVQKICRFTLPCDNWPELPKKKIAVWIGAHNAFTDGEAKALERFLRNHNAVALVSKQSSYTGYGAVSSELLCAGNIYNGPYASLVPEVIVHIGQISAGYCTAKYLAKKGPTWRVNEDGEIQDVLQMTENIFAVPEKSFFEYYADRDIVSNDFYGQWRRAAEELWSMRPELPFSNYWIAQSLYGRVPQNVVLHLSILSTIRAWNFCPHVAVQAYTNSGGFGIDGAVSSMIGASLVAKDKLHLAVVGDLNFFYDLNAIGNRHIGSNLRILIANNGEGIEFSLSGNPGHNFGDKTANYIGAGRHFGNKSKDLVRHYAEDLGFLYLTASNKDEFEVAVKIFLDPGCDRPIVFECFIDGKDDIRALDLLSNIIEYKPSLKSRVGSLLPSGVKEAIRKVI